ncbi:MAG: 3-dehydroquinate synthase [Actinomycetota bacterium]
MIVLVGFMGAGKSTVGRLLAARLGMPFVDSDDEIERRAGASIADIFATEGEPGFRRLEREVATDLLGGADAVIALGGGALEDPITCGALEWATVAYLEVGYGEALRRIGPDGGRPMLAVGDPRALYERRRGLYERVADVTVATDGRRVADIVAELQRRASPPVPAAEVRRVTVAVPGRPYSVVVGSGAASHLGGYLPPLPDAEKAFVVSHPSLRRSARASLDSLGQRGLDVHWSDVPEGEVSKSLAGAQRLYDELAAAGAHRHDLVVGFGGGVITDLAGYVASTYHRGMAVVHVPTTLLGQVDAAIGGKTGVNLAHGKNLVGTIHQPGAVVCDVNLLRTLPPAEVTSGMAEVVKYGFIADPDLLTLVRARASDIAATDAGVMIEIVARSAAIKASIVAADEREHGERAFLNYGHTFAHALEHVFGFRWMRHGEAVALGMMAAAHLANELGRIDDDDVELHRDVLASVGLPTSVECELDDLERAWRHDKKYRRGVRFVLLAAIGKPEAGISVPEDALARALARLAK